MARLNEETVPTGAPSHGWRQRFLSPGATAFLQANIAARLAAGFTVREALRLTRSIAAYINGIVLAEVAASPSPQSSSPARRPPGKHRGRS